MKKDMYGEVNVWIQVFVTSALDRGEWSVTRSDLFNPEKIARRYVLDKRLDGPQSPFRRCGVVKILDIAETRTSTLRSSSQYIFLQSGHAVGVR
jgi:hypothetical protein